MNCQEKRKQSVTAGLNNIQLPVILGLTGFRRQSLFRQRCIVPIIIDDNRAIPDNILDYNFPRLFFSEKDKSESLEILNYVESESGRYILDLVGMCRNKDFKHLFHEDFTKKWDENAARKKYGRPDVIRFFIDIENERFLGEFNKLKYANLVNIDKDAIPNMFLNELWLNLDEKKPVREELDFSKIVMHKSPTIYKAFERYAHKMYILMGFGLLKLYIEKRKNIKDCGAAEILLAGNMMLDAVVRKEIPKADSLSFERRIAIYEAEHEILEIFQKVNNKYVPYLLTDIQNFVRQFRSRLRSLLKIKSLDNPDRVNHVETFNAGDRKNIKKYFENLGQYIDNMEDFNEYHEARTYREKLMFFYQRIGFIRTIFSKRQQEIIWGLINKSGLPVSFDESVKNNENGESFSLYETTKDDKNVPFDEHLRWATVFTNVFKQEFDETQMKKFLECIPSHFREYPLKYDEAGNINMVNHSKKQLYKTFCIITGRNEEQKMWRLFKEMIQEVIDEINRIRSQ